MKRFPFGLTVAALIAFAFLAGLGVWQVQRLAWKRDLLTKIEALRHAPPQPASALAMRMARGEDVGFTRVQLACTPPSTPSPTVYRYGVHQGAVAWRLLGPCHAVIGGYDGIVVDRGVVERFTGLMAPTAAAFSAPVRVTGILRAPGRKPIFDSDGSAPASGVRTVRIVDSTALARIGATVGLNRPIPYLLAAESETSPPQGVTPAALPQDIPNNHFVYALTWFAFAGMLACFYGALVWRRMRTP